jgi:hypothetical protein
LAHNKTDNKESDDDEEEGPPIWKIKLSELKSHYDDLIPFMNSSSEPEFQPYYSHFWVLTEIIIQKH